MTSSFRTAEERWAGLGPYYAMFPLSFTKEVIEGYSKPGEIIFDPFAGRGSSVYAAATTGRAGIGIEISPVGWIYGRVKLSPARESSVIRRLEEISFRKNQPRGQISKKSLKFFNLCFSDSVFNFLKSARTVLAWRTSIIDATLMAFILVYLHGKSESSLSNQLRQGKAMSPDYSVRWWNEKGSTPPEIDPIDFLKQRIRWRYEKGIPNTVQSHMLLGDCTKKVNLLRCWIKDKKADKFSLLFTSPPYNNVADYHYDQWLRIWMLGGPDYPTSTGEYYKGKFESKEQYRILLEKAFEGSVPLLKKDAVIYVRTDARPFTFVTTLKTLLKAFPKKDFELIPAPYKNKTQTSLFGDHGNKPGEIDIVLR